jgi:type IV secretory pathway VirB4 component
MEPGADLHRPQPAIDPFHISGDPVPAAPKSPSGTQIGFFTEDRTFLLGMTGAGKSVIVADLLAQQLYTDIFNDWIVAN